MAQLKELFSSRRPVVPRSLPQLNSAAFDFSKPSLQVSARSSDAYQEIDILLRKADQLTSPKEESTSYPDDDLQELPFVDPTQTFTEVKYDTVSKDAQVLELCSNVISFGRSDITVVPSGDLTTQWEVESGLLINKFVTPVPYTPYEVPEMGVIPLARALARNMLHKEQWMVDSKEATCPEFQSPLCLSEYLVTATISQAKKAKEWLCIGEGGNSTRSSSSSRRENFLWPSIKIFNKEKGSVFIETYILDRNDFIEDWRYCIKLKGYQRDVSSDFFFYEAIFSLPNRVFPVPQVSATVFFTIEASREIPADCPVKVTLTVETTRRKVDSTRYVLKDAVLLGILDLKLKNFSRFTF